MSRKVIILGYSGSVHVARWAKGLTERGFDISIISLGGKDIGNIETIVFPERISRTLSYLKYMHRVKKIINSLQPDLVHAHYATGFGLWGLYSSFHPYLISVWGADVIDFPNTSLKCFLLKKILHSANFISATSHFLKKKTLSLYPELESKISVIPFGVNIPKQVSAKVPDRTIRLVYIKAHRKKYGPDILLQAMHLIIRKNCRVHLSLAGEGELTETLKERVRQSRLANHVTFEGFIDNQKIFDFLSRHDIMVMPSVMESESFGVAVLEAAAVGLPVIASDIGGVPEVLKAEETGILVPPGDAGALSRAIIRLAKNADLRKKMGEAGRKLVAENYRWDNCLDMMADLYERLISGELRRSKL